MGRKKNPESAIRLNFLHQASCSVLESVPSGAGKVLAAMLGHHMIMVGKKSQVRLGKEIKRRICKVDTRLQCNALKIHFHFRVVMEFYCLAGPLGWALLDQLKKRQSVSVVKFVTQRKDFF